MPTRVLSSSRSWVPAGPVFASITIRSSTSVAADIAQGELTSLRSISPPPGSPKSTATTADVSTTFTTGRPTTGRSRGQAELVVADDVVGFAPIEDRQLVEPVHDVAQAGRASAAALQLEADLERSDDRVGERASSH